jgi:hypothetical protein
MMPCMLGNVEMTSRRPDGVLYHVRGTSCPDLDSIAEAKAWADSQPWGPVSWDKPDDR